MSVLTILFPFFFAFLRSRSWEISLLAPRKLSWCHLFPGDRSDFLPSFLAACCPLRLVWQIQFHKSINAVVGLTVFYRVSPLSSAHDGVNLGFTFVRYDDTSRVFPFSSRIWCKSSSFPFLLGCPDGRISICRLVMCVHQSILL